jgi:hypothetical protein
MEATSAESATAELAPATHAEAARNLNMVDQMIGFFQN